MGATNNIKGTSITTKLLNEDCGKCGSVFTEVDMNEDNFEIWFDNSNDIELENIGGWYKLSALVRSFEHIKCPISDEGFSEDEDEDEDD